MSATIHRWPISLPRRARILCGQSIGPPCPVLRLPIVVGERHGRPVRGEQTVKILCPWCEGPRGGRRYHYHGVPENLVGLIACSSHCPEREDSYYVKVPYDER